MARHVSQANVIGFSTGLSGAKSLVGASLLNTHNAIHIGYMFVWLFALAQFNQQIRQQPAKGKT